MMRPLDGIKTVAKACGVRNVFPLTSFGLFMVQELASLALLGAWYDPWSDNQRACEKLQEATAFEKGGRHVASSNISLL